MLPITPARRPRRRPIALALAAFALAASFAAAPLTTTSAAATSAPAASGGTDGISGSPADASGADGRSRFSYQAAPGQHISDYYIVQNTGTTTQKMNVFATDAFNTDDGGYGLLNTADKPKDAGSWVTFAGGATHLTVPLAPKQSKVVLFSVDVPKDASPGDHAAGIVISVTTGEGQILVDRRVATRLYVRVPGALQPVLTVSSLATSYSSSLNPFDGTTSMTMTVRNDGNVALAANMVIGVKTWFGIGTGETIRKQLDELLPRSTRTVTVKVHGVGQWGYVDPYVDLVPTVDKDALNPGPLKQISRDAPGFVMPWWALAILVVAAVIILFVRLRRRSDARNAQAWIAFTEEEARRAAAESAEQSEADAPREPVGAGMGRSTDGD